MKQEAEAGLDVLSAMSPGLVGNGPITGDLIPDPLLPGGSGSGNLFVVGLILCPHLDLFGLNHIVSAVELVVGHEKVAKEREGGRGQRGDEKWSDRVVVACRWSGQSLGLKRRTRWGGVH